MIYLLLVVFLLPIAYIARNELKGYLRVLAYRRQGIKCAEYLFWPIKIYRALKDLRDNDNYRTSRTKLLSTDANEPFYLSNTGSTCTVTITSVDAVKEFYKIETAVTEKRMRMKNIKFLGFFFDNGKKVQDSRAVFAEIFHYSNILKLTPQIKAVIKRYVSGLRSRVEASEGPLKIDFKKEVLDSLFEDLTACILLTGTNEKIQATFEGKNISQLLKVMFTCMFKSNLSFRNMIPFAEKLGLNKEIIDFRRYQKGFQGIIKEEYRKRYNAGSEKLQDNSVMDIMVKLNKESEKKTGKSHFSIEEISSNFEIFQFAASDTSYQSSTSCITLLSLPENKVYQTRLREELQNHLKDNEDYDNDFLGELKQLDITFRETMRMANPAAEIAARTAIKDFELCGKTIYKGDRVRHILLGYQPDFYQDPLRFEPERFAPEKRKEIPFVKHIPFSHGKRGCIGKYLGEMMVKMIVAEFVRVFRFEVEDGFKVKWGMSPVYGVNNPELLVSLA